MKRGLLISGLGVLFAGLGFTIAGALSGGGTGKVHLTILNKPTVMTAAYKVYGDPEAVGGKFWLSKLTLRNDGVGPLKNVRISYQVPEYISWTTPQQYKEILPGQTIVCPFYPRFPASVTKITSLTPTSVELKIEYNDGQGEQSRIERRDFKFRGIQQIEYSSLPPSEILTWYDANDNSELNCAWVTEQDPAVRAFYAKVSERSGGFGTMGDAKDITQLARSTYDFMVATGMTYSGTQGVVEKRGDGYVLVQGMRLPRDVLYGNSGLCVELAQLWASIAINAGAKCYLVMIPGHCFPVLQASDFGDGTLLPIEATGIGGGFKGGNLGAPMSFENAVKIATENFQKVRSGEIPGIIIDVGEYRNQGIRPPELADIDRTEFTKMLDDRLKLHQEIVAAHQQGGQGQPAPQMVQNDPNNPQLQPQPQPQPQPMADGVTWQDPNGRVSVTYPANWQINPQAPQNWRPAFPGYTLAAEDPQTHYGMDIIFFNGSNDPQQVAQQVANTLQNIGAQAQLGPSQPTQFNGVHGVIVPMRLGSSNGQFATMMAIAPVSGGIVVINLGAPQQSAQGALPTFQKIFESLKIGR
jgi:hypothetical protein